MNIAELSEKNIQEARELFIRAKTPLFEALSREITEEDINHAVSMIKDGIASYLLVDKGVYQAFVEINKPNATIDSLYIDFDLLDEQYLSKFMEFVIKQFSSINLVFIWVDSVEDKLTELIENYGFEYTGEQNYIDKEKNLLSFRYVYRRKR